MDELLHSLRGLIQHGVLHRVDDSGDAQRADVETAEGVVRGGVQVLQPPGLACNPGTDGVRALVLAVGGDQGIPVIIVSAAAVGMGNLGPLEAMLYALDGSVRVHCKPGGELHIVASTKVTVEAPEIEATATTKATVTAPEINLVGAVNITGGPLKVNGVTVVVP
jgi:phage gp45-like